MKHNPPPDSGPRSAYPAFSLPLQRHYYRAGREACARMSEDQPMVTYLRTVLDKLIHDLDNPDDIGEAVRYWTRGFQSMLLERIGHWQRQQGALQDLLDGTSRVNVEVRPRNQHTGLAYPRPGSGPRKARHPSQFDARCCNTNPFHGAGTDANDVDDDGSTK